MHKFNTHFYIINYLIIFSLIGFFSSFIYASPDLEKLNVPDNTLCEVLKEFGCTNEIAINYNLDANVDDGSCIIQGCTNILSFNYDAQANLDDGSCTPFIYGCTLEFFANFNPNANIDNGTCSDSQDIIGCMDNSYYEYDSLATINNSDYCLNLMVFGCMDDTMKNYSPAANFDDDSCIPFIGSLHFLPKLIFETFPLEQLFNIKSASIKVMIFMNKT